MDRRRRWRDLLSTFSMYRYDASYAVEVQRATRWIRDRQAGRSRRSSGGRCHRRLEADTGRGRHPYHDDKGSDREPVTRASPDCSPP